MPASRKITGDGVDGPVYSLKTDKGHIFPNDFRTDTRGVSSHHLNRANQKTDSVEVKNENLY
ncbi:MAG: hypothetical protein PVG08_22625 [Desulfobacterales bacterium]|jgi:hypothetical protein